MSEARYLCQRCGNCCRWPGFVRLDDQEINSIAAFLQLTPAEFIEQHTELRPSRSGLMLKSNPDGSCIFLKGINTLGDRLQPLLKFLRQVGARITCFCNVAN